MSAQDELNFTKIRLDQSEKNCKELQSQIANMKLTMKDTINALSFMKTTNTALEKALADTKMKYEDDKQKESRMNHEKCTELQRQITQTTVELAYSKEINERLSKELNALKAEFDMRAHAIEKSLHDKISHTEQQNSALQNHLASMKENYVSVSDTLKVFESNHSVMQKELAAIKQKLVLKTDQLANKEGLLHLAEDRCRDLQKQVEMMTQRINSASSVPKEVLEDSESQIEELKMQVNVFSKQVKAAEEQVNEATEKLDRAWVEKYSTLEAQLNGITLRLVQSETELLNRVPKELLWSAESRCVDFQNRLQSAEDRVALLEPESPAGLEGGNRLKVLEEEIVACRKMMLESVPKDIYQALEDKHKLIQRELEVANHRAENLNTAYNKVLFQCDSLEKQLSELAAALDEANIADSAMQSELQSLKNSIAEKEASLTAAQERAQSLNEKLKMLQYTMLQREDALSYTENYMQEQITELKSALAERCAEVALLSNGQPGDVSKKVLELETALSSQTNQLAVLEEVSKDAMQRRGEAEARCAELEEMVNALRDPSYLDVSQGHGVRAGVGIGLGVGVESGSQRGHCDRWDSNDRSIGKSPTYSQSDLFQSELKKFAYADDKDARDLIKLFEGELSAANHRVKAAEDRNCALESRLRDLTVALNQAQRFEMVLAEKEEAFYQEMTEMHDQVESWKEKLFEAERAGASAEKRYTDLNLLWGEFKKDMREHEFKNSDLSNQCLIMENQILALNRKVSEKDDAIACLEQKFSRLLARQQSLTSSGCKDNGFGDLEFELSESGNSDRFGANLDRSALTSGPMSSCMNGTLGGGGVNYSGASPVAVYTSKDSTEHANANTPLRRSSTMQMYLQSAQRDRYKNRLGHGPADDDEPCV